MVDYAPDVRPFIEGQLRGIPEHRMNLPNTGGVYACGCAACGDARRSRLPKDLCWVTGLLYDPRRYNSTNIATHTWTSYRKWDWNNGLLSPALLVGVARERWNDTNAEALILVPGRRNTLWWCFAHNLLILDGYEPPRLRCVRTSAQLSRILS